jgi:hypothetical protein
MFSGFPDNCDQDEGKEAYVADINQGMGWSLPEETMKVADVEENTALRNFYKLLMVTTSALL